MDKNCQIVGYISPKTALTLFIKLIGGDIENKDLYHLNNLFMLLDLSNLVKIMCNDLEKLHPITFRSLKLYFEVS